MPTATPDYLDLLGVPFVRGGRDAKSGVDCYGLIIELYRRQGIELPDFVSPGDLEAVEALIVKASKAWRKVPIGTIGSVVTIRVEGLGAHVGYQLTYDRFVHAIAPMGVTTDLISSPLFHPLAAYVYE